MPQKILNNDEARQFLMAAKRGQLKTIKLLIDKGTDIEAKDKDGWTALMLAEDDCNKRIVKILEKFKTKILNTKIKK